MTGTPEPSDNLMEGLKRLLPQIPGLVRMLGHRTFWTEADFDDVVQEIGRGAATNLYSVKECGEGDEVLRTYVMGIVRHKIKDRDEMNWRARKGIRHDIIAQAKENDLEAEAMMAEEQLDQRLQDCLFKLTEEDRTLLHLRYVSGMTLEGIAKLLDIHSGTVARRRIQLLSDLRVCLGSSGAYHFVMRYRS